MAQPAVVVGPPSPPPSPRTVLRPQLILLDLDDTLVFEQFRALPKAREALRLLRSLGYPLVLFTHNSHAQSVAIRADLFYDGQRQCECFFDFVAAGLDQQDVGHGNKEQDPPGDEGISVRKAWNLAQVRERYPAVPLDRMLLFDDYPPLIRWAQTIGLPARLVHGSIGLTIDDCIAAGLVPHDDVFGYCLL